MHASLRGRLKKDDRTLERIVVGDRVRLAFDDADAPTIEALLPRASHLVRAGLRGHKPKLVAANVDGILVVHSLEDPPFRADVVDLFLVLAESCDIAPTLVLNKAELPGASGTAAREAARYRAVGYPVLVTSAHSGEGIADLRRCLSQGIWAVVGPSGVGKSSLLNALDPALTLRTGEVSRRSRGGRHTTVSARLLQLACGGWVVDTPGFSDVALWKMEPAEMSHAFPEFREPSESCRFRGCSHLHEPDCGVREALESGAIDASRFESYRALREAFTTAF